MPLQDTAGNAAAAGIYVFFFVLMIGWLVLLLVAGWKLYEKASQPGWVSIIPFVNLFGLLKITHRPLWWFILFLIPIVNIFAFVIVMSDLSKAFGRGFGTTLLLIFLTPIAYLVLGFGDAEYKLAPDPIFS